MGRSLCSFILQVAGWVCFINPVARCENHPALNSTNVPMSYSYSGGGCYSFLVIAGVDRTSIINPLVSSFLFKHRHAYVLPMATVTGSGGSLYYLRYLALYDLPTAAKWSYPCYLLYVRLAEICYYHTQFGGISNQCLAEFYNVVTAAMYMVYMPLFIAYGGPLGTASTYGISYFPFVANLPQASGTALQSPMKFVQSGLLPYREPTHNYFSNWLITWTEVDPTEASQGVTPFNYGFQSYLPRGLAVAGFQDPSHQNCPACTPYANESLMVMCFDSAALGSGLNLMPFAFAGKTWDGIVGNQMAAGLKIFSMIISLIMVKKMMWNHMLPSSKGVRGCPQGCPVLDSAFTDAGPLTPNLAYNSKVPPSHRAQYIFLVGPASSFSMYRYFGGEGQFAIWEGGGCGVNLCPFTDVTWCTMLTQLRKAWVSTPTAEARQAYFELSNAFGVYLPENQVISPYCGDPLAFDAFQGECEVQSVCHLHCTVIPSFKMGIQFSPDEYQPIFSLIYLASTPMARNFVETYLPHSMQEIQYYMRIKLWFPNFSFMAIGKGGFGWTHLAGNALMDYMTFAIERLAKFLLESQKFAAWVLKGSRVNCPLYTYEYLERTNLNMANFLSMQRDGTGEIAKENNAQEEVTDAIAALTGDGKTLAGDTRVREVGQDDNY